MKSIYESRGLLGFLRFLFLLGIVVWLGGLAFVAVGAPAMFKVNRSLGPQMVGAALAAFTPVTYVCAVLMLLGWLGEGLRHGEIHRAIRKSWLAQGACIFVMLLCAVYAGKIIMPQMVSLQPTVVAAASAMQNRGDGGTQSATASSTSARRLQDAQQVRVRFDVLHKKYRSVTSTIVLFGLASLALFAVRISRAPLTYQSAGTAEAREDVFVTAALR
jgi:hypothetical protein